MTSPNRTDWSIAWLLAILRDAALILFVIVYVLDTL